MSKQTQTNVVATVWRHWKPTFMKNKWGVFFTFLFYSLSAYFDLMAKPTKWKEAFDALSTGHDPWPAFRSVMMLMAAAWVMARIGEYMIVISESAIIKQLRDYTLFGLLGKSSQFFTNHPSGGLVAKAKRFANSSEVVVDQMVFSIIRSTLLVIYLLIYSAIVLPKVAIIFLIWVILFLTTTMILSHVRMKYDLATSNADSMTTTHLSDKLISIFTLRIFSRTPQEYQSFTEITTHEKKSRMKSWFIGNAQWGIQALFMISLEICCMYYIINQVRAGKETIGTAVMLQTYIVTLAGNMWNFGQSWIRIRTAFADAYEMSSLLDKPNTEPVLAPTELQPLHHNGITFENVNFSYFDGTPIIKNLSFNFKPGNHYGIIGKTGSGKTTLTQILMRFYNYDSGSIMIGGHHLNDVHKLTLRSWISYVTQHATFPSRIVRDIITLGKDSATDEEVADAIKKAACDFVWELPNGIHTEIGERGVRLSGGQCQRLSIAAAILKDAPIVIMDEPTSALDAETERIIQDSIRNYFQDKTLIVIAHRLSTVAILDEIIYIKNGHISASAPHAELLEISDDYRHLWDLQTKPHEVLV